MTTDTLDKLESAVEALSAKAAGLAKLGDLGAKFEALDDVTARLAEIEQKAARRGSGPARPKTMGQQVIDHPEFKSLGRGATKLRLETKAPITSASDSGGGGIATDERLAPLDLPRRKLSVRDVVTTSETTSNAVFYLKQTVRANNAAPVAEGTLKPESSIAWERQTANVVTIAHWIPATVQLLDDAQALRSKIDQELSYGVALATETQMLSGDGTGENLNGLLTQATPFAAPFTGAGETALDRIIQAMAQLHAADYEPDAIVISAVDWARMSSVKDGEGRYILGSPISPTTPRLWGLPIVVSNSMPADTFLVGALRMAATLYVRQEITVEIGFADDDFLKNMLRLRAECRVALAVERPDAMVTGSLFA